MSKCGTLRYGLVVMVVLIQILDVMFFEVFSKLSYSVILDFNIS